MHVSTLAKYHLCIYNNIMGVYGLCGELLKAIVLNLSKNKLVIDGSHGVPILTPPI